MDDLNAAISLNGKHGIAYVARSLAFRAMNWDAESENDLKLALAPTCEIEPFIYQGILHYPTLHHLALSLFDVSKEA